MTPIQEAMLDAILWLLFRARTTDPTHDNAPPIDKPCDCEACCIIARLSREAS